VFGFDTRVCVFGKDLSLKIREVAHPETSYTGRCVHSERVSRPNANSPQQFNIVQCTMYNVHA